MEMTVQMIDDIANEAIDCIRKQFGLDIGSDEDDELYNYLHNNFRCVLEDNHGITITD